MIATNPKTMLLNTLTTDITLDILKSEHKIDAETQRLCFDIPPGFIIENDILYIVSKSNMKRPFILTALRHKLLTYFHDPPHCGHMGVRKTTFSMQRRVYWKDMQQEIFDYIKTCVTCQTIQISRTKP